MAYPTNFEFNGVNLNSIGYTIVSFDGATNGEQDYEDALSYNISKAANNPQTQIHGFHTESTKKFDFSYYMSSQGYSKVDYVFIHLGTNDLANSNTETLSYFKEMTNSIKAFNSNIVFLSCSFHKWLKLIIMY